MALRLAEHVISGTIDNSVKGTVSGEIRLEGIAEPLHLELQGNAQPDLAGCVLTFSNRGATPVPAEWIPSLETYQRGQAGELSASQKRKVYDFSEEEAFDIIAEGTSPASTWKNILYLEWFSNCNGRIVIEAVDYEWAIDLPRWRMTDEDLQEQTEISTAAADLLREFAVERYEEINEEIRTAEDGIDSDADDEFSWERRFQEADKRTDAFKELLDGAESPEEMEAIFKRVYENAERSADDDLDFDAGEESDAEPDYLVLNDEIRELCENLQAQVDEITSEHYTTLPEGPESADFLSLIVKSGTGVTLVLDEDIPYQRGFLIAHIKREIARCQKLIPRFQELAGEEDTPIIQDLWKVRDLLVQLAGKLRTG